MLASEDDKADTDKNESYDDDSDDDHDTAKLYDDDDTDKLQGVRTQNGPVQVSRRLACYVAQVLFSCFFKTSTLQ